MQRFAVIGLGRFGSRLASNLAAAGQDVIGIDENPKIIEKMRDQVTHVIAMDATDAEALRHHGIDRVDAAVVGIGVGLEPIILTTVMLKQLGVPRVIARAITPTSVRILRQVGADEIVSPEDEAADRWANQLVNPHFSKHFGLDERHSIVEMRTPEAWVGQTLIDLRLRQKRGLYVVAIKRARADGEKPMVQVPDPTTPLAGDDLLVLMGADRDLAKVREG